MSLALRKEAQDSLNGVGLQGYHVRINDHKQLIIVGECGQPLFTIAGIAFGRTTPTGPEIEYAIELLDVFLIRHTEAITNYIRMNAEFIALPVIELKCGDLTVDVAGNSCSWTKEEIKTTLNKNKNGEYTISVHATKVAVGAMTAFKVRAADIRTAKAYLEEYNVYRDKRIALGNAKIAMSKCDV